MSTDQKIKIKLKAFDHRLLDGAVANIVRAVKMSNSRVKGPIPLPNRIQKFTVTRSPHVNKSSREQFEIRDHKRMMIVDETNPQTIDALMKLELPAGVEAEIALVKNNPDKKE